MLLLLVSLILLASLAAAAPSADQITALPGWNQPFPSVQYSGYLKASETKFLHYWFVASEGSPLEDPVTLWLNGGPGCSSMGGFLYENGPFHVNESDWSSLYYNENTWARASNMLYIEAPIGVGFSYSTDPSEYLTINDTSAAMDNLHALEYFFTLFPEYAKNDFYISGESYAGVYVPTLAYQILLATQAGTTAIPLKGFAVGNGCTGSEVGACAARTGQSTPVHLDYYYTHALCSEEIYNQVVEYCGNFTHMDSQCQLSVDALRTEIGKVNMYNIYDVCVGSASPPGSDEASPFQRYSFTPVQTLGPAECIDSFAASAYLNTPSVMAAIHVIPSEFGNWSVCLMNRTAWSYTPTEPDLPRDIYPKLIPHYRILVYNGDVDGCVPYTDNERWTVSLGLTPRSPGWQPWLLNEQVAGYVTYYVTEKGFAFLTVKGAGHMVPQYQPPAAFRMFTRFLQGINY